jgi:hypothetical protein
MRVENNNSYAAVNYQDYADIKRVASFSKQDGPNKESLDDESRQIKNVYHDFKKFIPLNFRGAYIQSQIQAASLNQKNSINLSSGTTFSLGEYSGQDVMISIGDSSVNMSWGTEPIGSSYVKKFNDTIRSLLKGNVDENGVPDLSKLTRQQISVLDKVTKKHETVIMKMGGVDQYESIRKIGESFDYLIRVSNSQMPEASLSLEDQINTLAGLEKIGIDTSNPFYINDQKLYFSKGGVLERD